MEVIAEKRVPIRNEADIVTARQQGRMMAAELAFSMTDQAAIATAISELTRNIVAYAKVGEIILRLVAHGSRQGIVVVAQDAGPGIANLALAMQDGFSTSGGLGMGLPGTRRLMDEFDIVSASGQGTTITIKKWKR